MQNKYNREDSSSDGEDDEYSDWSLSRNGDRRRNERPCKRGRKGHSSSSHNENHREARRRPKKAEMTIPQAAVAALLWVGVDALRMTTIKESPFLRWKRG
jgi:hypothetical protein